MGLRVYTGRAYPVYTATGADRLGDTMAKATLVSSRTNEYGITFNLYACGTECAVRDGHDIHSYFCFACDAPNA